MADVKFSCSIPQGFNYQKDSQETVGHLVSMQIGDNSTVIKSDLKLQKPGTDIKYDCVGVIENVTWNGGHGDPIDFACNVSTLNRQKIDLLRHLKLKNTELKIKFEVWQYDPLNKKYFTCMAGWEEGGTAPVVLDGLIKKESDKLKLEMPETKPATEIVSPENWKLNFSIMPTTEKEQKILYATADQMNVAKAWGVKVTK
ncbi:MAG: hypothetical protein ACAI25_02800 [Planctomycetota bacterium]